MITDMQRAELINSDINTEKQLSEQDYRDLLLEIKHRRESADLNQPVHAPEKAAPEVAEGVAWTLLEMNEASVEQAGHAAKGLASFLDKLGPIGLLITNGVGLLLTPWRCYKEKRWPTRDEWIKLALSAATIVFVAVALAVPMVAAGFFIAAATFGFIKSIQNIRAKREELERFKDRAQLRHDEMKRLDTEITELQKVQSQTEEQKQTLSVKISQLTAVTDQYVQEGYHIHRLKEARDQPAHSFFHKINVAMSAVALIGVVLSVFFPPVGAAILLAAGVVSLTGLAVSAVSKSLANRDNQSSIKPMPPSPKEQPSALNDHPSVTESKGLDHTLLNKPSSTAEEFILLQKDHALVHSTPLKTTPQPTQDEKPKEPHPANENDAHSLPVSQTKSATLSTLQPPVPTLSPAECEEVERRLKLEMESVIGKEEKTAVDKKTKEDDDEEEDEMR